jgi:hypothetical protein
MEAHKKTMLEMAGKCFDEIKKVDPMHIIESIEAEDAYTAKLFDDTFKDDPETGKGF